MFRDNDLQLFVPNIYYERTNCPESWPIVNVAIFYVVSASTIGAKQSLPNQSSRC